MPTARVRFPDQACFIIRCKNLPLKIRDYLSLCLSEETLNLKAVGPFYIWCLCRQGKWHIWRFLLHKFNRLAAFLDISSVCLLNDSLLSRTTPRYLSDCMSSRCVSCRWWSVIRIPAAALCISGGTVMVEWERGDDVVYWNLIAFFVRLVIRRILHFLIINFICHVTAHSWSLNISCWSILASFGQLISRYMALSSANNLIFDVRCYSMSFM